MGFRQLHNQRGAALMIVLVMVVILGLTFGWCGMTWKTVRQREKEEELLWRGTQIRRAIENFVRVRQAASRPGTQQNTGFAATPANQAAAAANYPRTLEDLIKDPGKTGTVRHLRKIYKDPITGEDFEVITAPGGGIKGVKSASKEKPMKTDGFPKEYEPFKDAENYAKWEFVYEPGSDVSQSTTAGGSVDGGTGVGGAGRGTGSGGRGGFGADKAPFGELPPWLLEQKKK